MGLKYISQFWIWYISFVHFVSSSSVLNVPDNSYTCVIGGGYSGLATARYLKQFGLNFTLFERSRAVGGTWRFDPHIGVDEDGVPVSTSQYKYLRTNSPIPTMEFKDFPSPEPVPTFPSGTCFYKYIKSFVKHFNLMTNIQLRSYVQSVKRLNKQWELSYYRTDNKENYTLLCDFMVIATGQYTKPHVPKFAGSEIFQGKIIHSHDYKSSELYKDRKVLLVGIGPSGIDIAAKLHEITTKLIHSHHFVYKEPKFSERYIKKPDIKEFVHNGVIFNDSSFEEVEDVILATGYRLEHPFLDESSGLTMTSKFVLPLFNQVVNIHHPSMLFIGISNHYINRIIDVQAEYIALLIAGKFQLPTQKDMLETWQKKYTNRKLSEVNMLRFEVKEYFLNLTREAGVTTVPPVIVDIMDVNVKNILDDILHYREYEFEILDNHSFKSWRKHNVSADMSYECPIEDLEL